MWRGSRRARPPARRAGATCGCVPPIASRCDVRLACAREQQHSPLPVFFIRDGIKFSDFIHSQKYEPFTNRQEPNNVWDFFSHSPEATHQFTWLFGGERCWVKFHFKTNQGIRGSLQDHLGCQRSLQFAVRRLAGSPRCLTNHVLPEMASPLPHSGRRGSLTDRSVKCVDTTKH